MAWLDDLKAVMVAAGLPTGSIFLSSAAVIPVGAGPYISIVDTGGTAPDRTQNTAGDAYENPAAQIMARATSYVAAQTMLSTAYAALVVVQNTTINGVWYSSIRPLQSRFIDLGLESQTGRARLAFNVLGNKR